MDEIIVREDDKFLILTELETISFHSYFMAYEVERTNNRAVVLRHDLPWHGVLHIVQKNGKKFIWRKTLPVSKTHFKGGVFYFTFCHCLHTYRTLLCITQKSKTPMLHTKLFLTESTFSCHFSSIPRLVYRSYNVHARTFGKSIKRVYFSAKNLKKIYSLFSFPSDLT